MTFLMLLTTQRKMMRTVKSQENIFTGLEVNSRSSSTPTGTECQFQCCFAKDDKALRHLDLVSHFLNLLMAKELFCIAMCSRILDLVPVVLASFVIGKSTKLLIRPQTLHHKHKSFLEVSLESRDTVPCL